MNRRQRRRAIQSKKKAVTPPTIDASRQNGAEATGSQSNVTTSAAGGFREVPTAKARTPKATREAAVGAGASKGWWKRWKPSKRIIGTAGVIAGIGYAVITYCQWRDVRNNFLLDQRAWLGITRIDANLDPSKPTNILIHVSNSGKTMARRARSNHIVECLPRGAPPQFLDAEGKTASSTVIAPGSERVFTHVNICSSKTDGEEEPARVRDVLTGALDLYVYGTIWYEDIFGTGHWTTFCNIYDLKAQKLNGCSVHNDAN
jgi:hypothetical protein